MFPLEPAADSGQSNLREEMPPDLDKARRPATSDDRFAAALRGFGPVGIAAIVVIFLGNAVFLPFSAILVLIWAWRSRTPWKEIGYLRPKSWLASTAIGIVLGCALKLVMKILVMPLLGADPINQTFHYLAGNRAALPGMLYAVIIGAGFGEETMFRGYLFERFGKLFGQSLASKTVTVLITSVWFGLAHYSLQGVAGTEQAFITGLVFGTIFATTGRIWMLMVAHASFDLTAVAIIYWDWETRVAHLIFK